MSERAGLGTAAAGGVAAVIAVPAVVAIWSLIGRHWFPANDYAFITRRVADVGGRHTPLVGVYSRFGWDHPGPLLFWLLAPFQHLAGPIGLLAGAAVLNVACLTGALLVARRRGGPALMLWVALLLAVLCHALGTHFLIDPWNPYLPVTGLVWYFLLAWSVACGDEAMWPWLVGVGTWEVQAHVGFAPVVGVLAVFALVASLVARPATPPPWRSTLAVGAVLWAAPVLQQLAGHPGNLAAITRYVLHPSGSTLGWTAALKVAGKQLSFRPPWVTGRETTFIGILQTQSIWAGLVQLGLLGAAGGLAWWRGQRDAALLAGLSLAAVVAGLAGLARIAGLPFPYLARWMWVIAMFVSLAAGWCVAVSVRWPRPLPGTVVALAAGAGLVVTGVTATAGATPAVPVASASRALTTLVPATEGVLDRRLAYRIEPMEATVLGPGLGVGLQAALERHGYHAYLGPDYTLQAGSWRTTTHHRVDQTLAVVSPADPGLGFAAPDGWAPIAHFDPLTPAQRARADTLEERIRRAMGDRFSPSEPLRANLPVADAGYVARGATTADVVELAALSRPGDVYDIYLHPG